MRARHDYEVLWVAQDGQQAVDFCTAQRPDIVLMDLVMPNVDGIEATRRIMAQAPCAILIVTVDVGANAWRVYEAMGAGALDAVDTPVAERPGRAQEHRHADREDRPASAALVTERNAPGSAAAAAPRAVTTRDTRAGRDRRFGWRPGALATLARRLAEGFRGSDRRSCSMSTRRLPPAWRTG